MPDIIDEKVVSMRFDNKEFEEGVAESLQTIRALKKSLNFDESVKNLDGLRQAGKRFDFSGVSDAIDTVKNKFSALEIAGITALVNLTNSAVDAGKRIVSSLTIDPVKQGIGTYEQKLNSVQTIMNNSGKTLEETMEILDELNTYSDKTIFSLSDMTTALGKFTAAGVDAKKAVTIIKGAANEAATMGAGSAEFSRFIYNLSQAYSVGKMTMIDWKSLENAGVAGMKFKQILVDIYKEEAKLGKVTDKFINQVSATNLREYLKEGIITNDIMTKAFERYADEKDALGKAATAAAQQVKTFHQLLDVLQESVASQWSQSWSYIIGNFDEARRLWTAVSALFDSTIGKINQARNELLRAWHDGFIDPETDKQISGRTMLIDGLCNLLLTIKHIITPIKEAFRELFPKKTAEGLWEATRAFRDFTAKLKLSEGAMKNIHDFAAGLFSVMRLVKDVFRDVLHAIFPATEGMNSLLGMVIGLAGAFGRWLKQLTEHIRSSEEYQTILAAIGKTIVAIIKIVAILVRMFYRLAKATKQSGVFAKVLNVISGLVQSIFNVIVTYGPTVVNIIGTIFQLVSGLAALLLGGIGTIGNFFVNLFSKKEGEQAADGIKAVTKSMSNLTKTDVASAGENVSKGFGAGLLAGIGALLKIVAGVFKSVIATTEDTLDEHSPSKIFMAIGAFCLAGFLIGITNPTIKSKIATALQTFAQTDVVNGFKRALAAGFNGIAKVWAGAVKGITEIIKAISLHFQGAEGDTKSASSKIGGFLNGLIGQIKQINGAAVILTMVIGGAVIGVLRLLKTVVNVTHAFDEIGGTFYNITAGFRSMAKAFKAMGKAFYRQSNPILTTIRAIAFAILAVTTAIFVLSTIEDKAALWTAFGTLVSSFVIIVASLVGASALIKKANLEDTIKTLSQLVVTTAAAFLVMTVALSTMAQLMSNAETNGIAILEALGVFALIGIGMYFFIQKLADLPIKEGTKVAFLLLGFSAVMFAVSRALKSIADAKDMDAVGDAAWCLLGITLGLSALSWATRGVNFSGVLLLLSITLVIKSVVKAIADVEWTGVMQKIIEYQDTLIVLVSAAGIMSYLASKLGRGMMEFGVGVLAMVSAVAGMMLAFRLLNDVRADSENVGKLIVILLSVGALVATIMFVCGLAHAPKEDMKNLSKLIFTMGLLMVELGATAYIVESSGAGPEMFAAIGATLVAFTFLLGFAMRQMKKSKNFDSKGFAKIIKSFTVPLLAMALLAKAMEGATLGSAAATIVTLAVVFGGLALLMSSAFAAKENDVKMVGKMVKLLIAVVLDIVILSMIPTKDLVPAMEALTVALLSIYLVSSAMSRVKGDTFKPMLASVATVLAIAGSLWLLATFCDWEGILQAALSMGAVMVSLGVALAIVSGFDSKAVNGALALSIAAAALGIAAFSIGTFATALNWDTVLPACGAIGALAVALYLIGDLGKNAVLGAASLAIAAVSLIAVAYAMKIFTESTAKETGQMAGVLGVLTGFVAIFGLFSEFAIMGSIGIIMASVGLIALAGAMQMFTGVTVGGGYLAGLAGGLFLLAVVGSLFTASATGLILGGIGLIEIAAALAIISNTVDNKIVNGKTLSGIALGLAAIGAAGVVLIAGSEGLIVGGIGLLILAVGLGAMSLLDYKQLNKQNLLGLALGLAAIAGVGLIGSAAGPGLVSLSVGLLALGGSIIVVVGALEILRRLMSDFSAEETETMGANTIAGYQNGIVKTAPAMLSCVGNVFKSLISGICGILGIHSPSTVMHKIAEFTGLGFIHGWAESPIVQKWDEISERNAKNHILAPFTDALTEGFGDIGGVFSNLLGGDGAAEEEIKKEEKNLDELRAKLKKLQAENADPRSIAGVMRHIGEVETRIYKLKENLSTNSLFGGFEDMFAGLTGGLDELKFEMPELDEILSQLDFSTDGLSMSFDDLGVSMEDVSAASAATTKTFAENMDIFDEFDRSLKTTINSIEKNMIDQLLGTSEWNAGLENLLNFGFDPRLVKEIKDKGMSGGYQIMQALNSIGSNFEEVLRWNEMYNKKFELGAENDAFSLYLDSLVESGKGSVQDLSKIKVLQSWWNGEYLDVADGRNDAMVQAELMGKETYDHAQQSAAWEARTKELLTQQELSELDKKKADEANAAAQNTTADAMMSEMSDAIKNAIKRYLPASAFIEIGENICLGLTAGVIQGKRMTVAEIENLCGLLKASAMQKLDEHSPSKVFEKIGAFCTEGLAIGLRDTADSEKAAKGLGANLIDLMRAQIEKIQDIMESDEIWQPTIRPVVDLTNLQASAEQAKMLFDNSQIEAASQDIADYRLTTQAPTNTIAGMSKNDFMMLLGDFAEAIVDGVNSGEKNVDVNVYLEGDTKRLFKAYRKEKREYTRTAGYGASV